MQRSDLSRRRSRPALPRFQQIAETLRQRIEHEELQPGQRLATVPQFAQEFGCGVSSVREALRVLENEQLLRIEHGRGIFVSDAPKLPSHMLEHVTLSGTAMLAALHEARRLIEPGLAAMAALRARQHDVEIIVDAAQRMKHCVDACEDFAEPDQLFHQQIAEAAGNPILLKMMSVVLELLHESRALTNQLPTLQPHAAQYHMLIAAAIADRDSGRADALMRAHLDDAKSAVDRARMENVNLENS